MLTLFGQAGSGNCYKVRLTLALCNRPYRYVNLDTYAGETRQPAYLAINPAGKIPALKVDDGPILTESNAIIWYLAQNTALWPSDVLAQQRVLSWLFWEQYSHEPKIAVARSWRKRGDDTRDPQGYAALIDGSRAALDYMQLHLAQAPYLVGDQLSIADISLYAYTHKIEDLGLSPQNWPDIAGWLQRLAAHPDWVSLDTYPQPTPLTAL